MAMIDFYRNMVSGVGSAPVPVELNLESSEETVTRTRSGRIS